MNIQAHGKYIQRKEPILPSDDPYIPYQPSMFTVGNDCLKKKKAKSDCNIHRREERGIQK